MKTIKTQFFKKDVQKLSVVSKMRPTRKSKYQKMIKVTLEKDKLTFTGSSGTSAISETIKPIACNTKEPVSFTVDAKAFAKAIQEFPNNIIMIEILDPSSIYIRHADNKLAMRIALENEYPSDSSEDKEINGKFKLTNSTLKTIIKEFSSYANENEKVKIVNGIHFKEKYGHLMIEATDKHTFSRKEYDKIKVLKGLDVVIPTETIKKCRTFTKGQDVDVIVKDNWIEFKNKNITLCGKLVKSEESYPVIEKIIPSNFPIELEIDSKEFKEAMNKCVNANANEKAKCKLVCQKDRVHLETKGEAYTYGRMIEKYSYNGDDFNIKFNAKLMMDILKGLEVGPQDKVKIEMADRLKPMKVTSNNKPEMFSILTPLR